MAPDARHLQGSREADFTHCSDWVHVARLTLGLPFRGSTRSAPLDQGRTPSDLS